VAGGAAKTDKMKKLNLRNKFIAGFCGLILLVGTALLLVMRAELHTYLEHELDKRGTTIARHMAEESMTPILTENSIDLQLLVNDHKKNEEDIRYIYIVNNRREVLAHTFGNSFPHDLLKTDHPAVDAKNGQIQLLQSDDGEHIEDVTAMISAGLGRVHVGISQAVIRTNLRAMVLHVLPVALAILCLGILVAALVAATITRPIKALAHGARMVGSGKLDWVIATNTQDEIGELAATFNAMTRELQRVITEQQRVGQELQLQAAELEQEVVERRTVQEELSVKKRLLEELNHTLEERINSAINDLRQKDQALILQNRMAVMGEMINNIAHQWRQPLNNIGLIIQNLQMSFDAGELTSQAMEKDVNDAMNTIFFMSRTIDDFRNFFRKDKRKSEFDLNKVVAGTVEFVAASLKYNNIRVDLSAEESVDATGYRNEFAQVLLNILSNARDALLEGKIQDPAIRIRIFSEEGRSVVVISDNAGGIPDDVLPRIFDPYFTTKAPGKGSGIGLYMSKMIIEQNMGGRLIASNGDGGAEFRIEV
jgi:signal transduction histidine kinase